MFAGLMTYYTVGFALVIVTIMIMTMSFIYRIREQAIRGAGLLTLALAFIVATVFQNSVTERLLVEYDRSYVIVKMLDVSVISAFKGPLIAEDVNVASWLDLAYMSLLVGFFILLTAALVTFLSVQMFGLDVKVAAGAAVVMAIIAGLGIYFTHQAINVYTADPSGNMAHALSLRDRANWFKLVSVDIPFLIMAAGSIMLFRETGTRVYLVYGVSIILGVIGFTLFATTWFHGWEVYVRDLAARGNFGPAYTRFALSAILMVIGALGLLVGNIIEAVPPVEEAEEFEEFVEAEEAGEFETEGAGEAE